MTINIEIGIGEAFDRLSILWIKKFEITDYEKNKNICFEYDYLYSKVSDFFENKEARNLFHELQKVNRTLWDVENLIRGREKDQKFDNVFIQLARSVYQLNDERAALKKVINNLFGSKFVEEKSYH